MPTRSKNKRSGFTIADRICNLVPSTGTVTDWTFGDAAVTGALTAAPPPPSVDLRESWWTIGDQEATGSCVGWATGDGVLRYELVKAGKLQTDERVSPRYVWMASKETDEFSTRPESFIEGAGTSLKAAVSVAKKYGVVLETVLPFHLTTTLYPGSENAFWVSAASRRVASYFNLGRDLEKWRNALAEGHPILVGLAVDATWGAATETGGLLDTFDPNTVRGGHAVCAVGYREDGRIILRNSWGTGWGDDGFAYASAEYIDGAFFPESYIVTI